MTDKQKAILDSALKLFAQKGFNAVPTSAIAKDAGVSEGLIFRHFENKAGLLHAIMRIGLEKIHEEVQQLNEIEDPRERVMTAMELPFHMNIEDYPFWRLLYSLKWQQENYDATMAQPIRGVLRQALAELKYSDIEAEVDLIESYMDGFVTTILLKGEGFNKEGLLAALKRKYN
jgi:AcrR family transcriptional regulator|tara:strand:+ start:32647 stop:33168 length:522 start_codon:yes stop_codon:yes gene_type:complete